MSVSGLRTHFFTDAGVVHAVDGIRLKLNQGETLGLVGESGSGKSVTALSIMRLVPYPGKILDGEVLLMGENLLEKSEKEMRDIRGDKISMIFQDPMTSLNPVLSIEDQVAEVIRVHQGGSRAELKKKVVEILETVGISNAPMRLRDFPHQFSGGMKQRVMIAIALACNPDLLIADEPTTNLDVTVQAQMLGLMMNLKKKAGSALILITHDLGVIAQMCDKVAVMYAGKIVEYCDVKTAFKEARHPYLRGLLEAIPRLDVMVMDRFKVIPGMVPELINPPRGCGFHERCEYAQRICSEQEPQPIEVKTGHFVSCLRVNELAWREKNV